MTEKRLKPRMHRRIPLSVQLQFAGAHSGEGQILEMSEGGLSFTTATPGLSQGDLLRLTIVDAEVTVQVDAALVYGVEQGGELVFGVQFGSVTETQREQIRELLQRHRFRKFRNPVTQAT